MEALTYQVYNGLKTLAGIILFLGASAWLLLVILLELLLYFCIVKFSCPWKRSKKYCVFCCLIAALLLFDQLTKAMKKYVFGRFLKKHDAGRDREPETIVFGFKAPESYDNWLLCQIVQLSGLALLVFWEDVLLQVSYVCTTEDPGLACFPSGASGSDLPLDCSNTDYLEQNNITSFKCYKFVFAIATASRSALGVLTIGGIFAALVTWFMLKLSNGKSGTRTRKWITTGIKLLGAFGTPILFYMLVNTIPAVSHTLYGTVYSGFKTSAVYWLILSVFTIPSHKFEKIEDNTERSYPV